MSADISASSEPSSAPQHHLPRHNIYSVEFPGYVQQAPASVEHAVESLGGLGALDEAFMRSNTSGSATRTLVELKFRPGNPFAHPVPGDVVGTSNLVVKVVKRRRKVDPSSQAREATSMSGEYTAEVVGVIPKTIRFRGMADFQYQPDMNDPISKLRLAMDTFDVTAIREYSIAPEQQDYLVPDEPPSDDAFLDPQILQESAASKETGNVVQAEGPTGPPVPSRMKSNLRTFPPPVFTRQGVPQNYNFKANTTSVVTTVIDEDTGEERKRLINRMRWKGYGPTSVAYTDSSVPTKPPSNIEAVRNTAEDRLVRRLEELFAERPIWTRASIFNQFPAVDSREIHNSKVTLPLVCYIFSDGPWRDTLVRFGYDPRKEVNARFYQRVYFRNINHPIQKPSVATRRQDTRSQAQQREPMDRNTHIFDGRTVTKETAAFQLCDITDPLLKTMIEDEENVRDECHERDGWLTAHAFEHIKIILRHKFFSLLDGYIPSDEECLALLERPDATTKKFPQTRKPRPGKHNMAKGALRPEDAAALRLRAKLDEHARNLKSQR